MVNWISEDVEFYDTSVWVYLTYAGLDSKGKQNCVMCIEHRFHNYDEIIKIAEILNDIIRNPSKLDSGFEMEAR